LSQNQWSAVDNYIVEKLVQSDPVLTAALQRNRAAGLPPVDVSAAQGKFLHLIAKMVGARRVLEIGTLGAYSTIWLARALPQGGRLVTLEADPHHAEIARKNIEDAGLAGVVDLCVGVALDTLPKLQAAGLGPFDLIFIDADRPNNPAYLEWALKLSRPGTVVIVDNVVRDGAVIDATSSDPSIQGVRTFINMLAADVRVSATALQTVGSKGWDGFVLALVQ
jgi:predicted O-methyltransferase YrrM